MLFLLAHSNVINKTDLLTLRGADLHITQWLNVVRREHSRLPVHLALPPLPIFAKHVDDASLVEGKLVRVLRGVWEHGQHLLQFGYGKRKDKNKQNGQTRIAES